jgi:hypothetical protein
MNCYPQSAGERMRAMAKKITWWHAAEMKLQLLCYTTTHARLASAREVPFSWNPELSLLSDAYHRPLLLALVICNVNPSGSTTWKPSPAPPCPESIGLTPRALRFAVTESWLKFSTPIATWPILPEGLPGRRTKKLVPKNTWLFPCRLCTGQLNVRW